MSSGSANTAIFAERELDAVGRDGNALPPVVVRFGLPQRDPEPGGDWMCPVQILGIQEDDAINAYGVDAVQAIQLAFQLAAIRLQSAPGRGITLSWLGGSELGFPLPDPAAADFDFEDAEADPAE